MRLNREGHLTLPSIELVQLLDLSRTLNRKTAGLFDPTIQPLWQLYGSLYETRAGKELPPHDAIAQRLQLIGLHHVHIEAGRIALDPDCSITLNGIAQGYITDRVAELLRRRGLDHILIDLGEVRALGPQPDGSPFRIAVPQSGLQVPLADAALAVSSPAGLLFAPEHGMGHILDPRTGSGRSPWRCIAVRHASAAVADGLSTAFVLADRAAITKTLQEVAGTRVWATRPDGSIETFA
jgi:thiamine biosynthesis lipoprotein